MVCGLRKFVPVDRPFARRCGFLGLHKRAVLIDPDGRKPAPGDAQRDQGNEVAIGEAGEIIARGPQIMPVTGASPAKPERSCAMAGCSPATSGKWMAGYFTIVDRRKDMILVSGFNVYPNEVEAVLAGLAGVKDCAVIGVPTRPAGKPSRLLSCAAIRRLTSRRCAISADANSPATKCRDWSSSATICRSRTRQGPAQGFAPKPAPER